MADESFRCGSEVVTLGESIVQALSLCGSPSYREILNPGIEGPQIENWFCNCGSGDFLYVLRTVGGLLESIKNEGFGSDEPNCGGAGNR